MGERLAHSTLQRFSDSSNSGNVTGRGQSRHAVATGARSLDIAVGCQSVLYMRGKPELATVFLQTIRNRVTDTGPSTTLDALSATSTMNAGNVDKAVETTGNAVRVNRRPITAGSLCAPSARRDKAASAMSSLWRIAC
ncbi:hypothetical protein [Mycobacterium uberis]|uniref:hypothetical protein n=1 Tax=Mycobacterium uberis TaxID=2162698 RepID=UPI0010588C81|nr:hypothetical protein [Mycobacterium uberis]